MTKRFPLELNRYSNLLRYILCDCLSKLGHDKKISIWVPLRFNLSKYVTCDFPRSELISGQSTEKYETCAHSIPFCVIVAWLHSQKRCFEINSSNFYHLPTTSPVTLVSPITSLIEGWGRRHKTVMTKWFLLSHWTWKVITPSSMFARAATKAYSIIRARSARHSLPLPETTSSLITLDERTNWKGIITDRCETSLSSIGHFKDAA